MKLNAAGRALIKQFEGRVLKAYRDPAGVLTIGYGHTSAAGPPTVTPGMVITEAEADAILARDLALFERGVDTAVRTTLNDNQFSALVSFAFNVGITAFRGSSVLEAVNERRFADVPHALALWNKVTIRGKKVVSKGLVNRRRAEAQLFMKPATIPQPDDPGPEPEPTPEPKPKSWWQRVLIALGLGGTAGGGAAYEYGVGLDILIWLGVLALVAGVVAFIIWRRG